MSAPVEKAVAKWGLKSAMKRGIHLLSDSWSAKAQSAVKEVERMQDVGKEELKWSNIDTGKKGVEKVKKDDLVEAEVNRADQFGESIVGDRYKAVSIDSRLPGYQDTVYTFKDKTLQSGEANTMPQYDSMMQDVYGSGHSDVYIRRVNEILDKNGLGLTEDESASLHSALQKELDAGGDADATLVNFLTNRENQPVSRYTSEHYGTPDYLMSTRIVRETLQGTKARVLMELQSDLHQAGQAGYRETGRVTHKERANAVGKAIKELESKFTSMTKKQQDEWIADHDLEEVKDIIGGMPNATADDYVKYMKDHLKGKQDFWEDAATDKYNVESLPPLSPWADKWRRQGITIELNKALADGEPLMAVINGSPHYLSKLNRGRGVQDTYDTQVMATMQKIADERGMKFEMVREGGFTPGRKSIDERSIGVELRDKFPSDTRKNLNRLNQIAKQLEREPFEAKKKKLKEEAGKISDLYKLNDTYRRMNPEVIAKEIEKQLAETKTFAFENHKHALDAVEAAHEGGNEAVLRVAMREQGGINYAKITPNFERAPALTEVEQSLLIYKRPDAIKKRLDKTYDWKTDTLAKDLLDLDVEDFADKYGVDEGMRASKLVGAAREASTAYDVMKDFVENYDGDLSQALKKVWPSMRRPIKTTTEAMQFERVSKEDFIIENVIVPNLKLMPVPAAAGKTADKAQGYFYSSGTVGVVSAALAWNQLSRSEQTQALSGFREDARQRYSEDQVQQMVKEFNDDARRVQESTDAGLTPEQVEEFMFGQLTPEES